MKKEILLLFIVNIGSALGYSLIAPLFPLMAIEKGLTETMIGLIISCFAIFNTIITPFSQNIFKRYGKRNTLLIGLILQVRYYLYQIGIMYIVLCIFGIYRFIFLFHEYFFYLKNNPWMFYSSHFNIKYKLRFNEVYSLGIVYVNNENIIMTLGFLETGWSI